MILTDDVEILRRETDGSLTSLGHTPAFVSYSESGTLTYDDGTTTRSSFLQQVKVMIGDIPFDAVTHRIRWNGNLYQTVGQPMIRRKNGRTHHKTIPVEVVT